MEITLTLAGKEPVTYPTPLAAVRALLPLLENGQLNSVLWGNLLRAESRRRWGCPGPSGEPGENVVLSVNGH